MLFTLPIVCLLCDQILQLYSALRLKHGILLTGVSATGKTTMYRILSDVLTKLHSHHAEEDTELKQTKALVFHSSQKLKVSLLKNFSVF